MSAPAEVPKIKTAWLAARFGCTEEQIKAQFARHAAQSAEMAEQAERTGKRVRGYTADELRRQERAQREASLGHA